MTEQRLQRILTYAIWSVLAVAMVIVVHRGDVPPSPPVAFLTAESAEPPVEPAPLSPDDAKLFGRLQAHIDARVEKRLLGAVEEAASDKKTGIGTLLAAALGKLVLKLVIVGVEAIIMAAVVALLWKWGLLIGSGFVALVTAIAGPAGWIAAKKAKG